MKRAAAAAALVLAAHWAPAAPLRDPFARPQPPQPAAQAGTAPPAQAAPKLRAVVLAPGHALADIDGQLLAQGAWFGEWKVAKIEERRVTLQRAGARTVLVLDREGEQ